MAATAKVKWADKFASKTVLWSTAASPGDVNRRGYVVPGCKEMAGVMISFLCEDPPVHEIVRSP
jgi:hypothetical protein